jgi:hypothetical protein
MGKTGKKNAGSPPASPATVKPPLGGVPKWLGTAILVFSLVIAVLAVGTIWGQPRPIGDLFVALAVGRDVLDGKLGKVDDWAFTTVGKVCINQNWGTHLLHYLVYMGFGTNGLLVLKAVMIAASALFICLAARQRNVTWPVALLVAAAAIAAGRSYIDLRANLTTLTLAPLAMWWLFKTRRNVHWMWAVMVLNGIWANVHGGFIFGLGMSLLWAAVLLVQRTIQLLMTQRPISAALRTAVATLWPLPAAAIGSVALVTFVNPYGVTNLLFPFTILSPAWLKLNEWQPLLAKTSFGTTWEFFLTTGVLGGLLLVRLSGIPGVPASYPRRPTLEKVCETFFDLAVTGVVIFMTFKARRFVPLSTIVMAPFLALQVQWLVRLLEQFHKMLGSALVGAVGVALFVPLLIFARSLWVFYDPNNPLYPPETVFERMSGLNVQPVKAAEFLTANRIGGRVFNEWRWEGYLHWMCPQTRVFIGGRAHQVYDPSTDELSGRILADARQYPDPKYRVNPTKDLANIGVHLVVVPTDPAHGGLLWHLAERSGATWGFIYYDGKDVVLADSAWPETAELIRRAASGELVYPDEATAALSRAMALAAQCLNRPPAETLEAFMAAAKVKPTLFAYNVIQQISRMLPDSSKWQKAYFQQEYARLEGMDYRQADGAKVLIMRTQVAGFLSVLYKKEGAIGEAARWEQAEDKAAATLNAIGMVMEKAQEGG